MLHSIRKNSARHLNTQHLTIISQVNAVGHALQGGVEESNVMTYVCDVGVAGSDATGEKHGIVHQLVGMVRLIKAQGVDNEYLHSFEIGQFGVVDGLHVGDVGE